MSSSPELSKKDIERRENMVARGLIGRYTTSIEMEDSTAITRVIYVPTVSLVDKAIDQGARLEDL